MNLTTLTFVIAVLAVWRGASLLANEDGPFYIFRIIRDAADLLSDTNQLFYMSHIHEGIKCEWCNSIWISSVLVWLFDTDLATRILLIFALSAGAIVFKYTVHTLEQLCTYFDNLNKQF